MNLDIISLDRSFTVVPKDSLGNEDEASTSMGASSGSIKWSQLEDEYRVVILAAAGAGKTVEMRSRAEIIKQSEKLAFFIRIEDLNELDFSWGFDVGSQDEFEAWLVSTEEAWFFLDSVDEARLVAPNAFEKALKRFAYVIKKSRHRAHIYISGRPYAWSFTTDCEMVERHLPFSNQNVADGTNKDSPLTIYSLNSLNLEDIRFYAAQRHVKDATEFVDEIERANLQAMASRPFDLDFLISTWSKEGKLGSRFELFERNVATRLDEIDPSRRQARPLKATKALEGASLLAGAVTFTGKSGIEIYDKQTDRIGVNAEVVLAEWEPSHVWTLLERGIFSDAIYNMVGFRHREIRDYLSAKWLDSLLKKGHSRRIVESLIFRDMYGEQVITPRLNTLVSWLILMDDKIRDKVLSIQPEIALNGGDVSHFPLSVRVSILKNIVNRIANDTDERHVRYNDAIGMIAKDDLVEEISSLMREYYSNDDVIFFLTRLLWQINQPVCLNELMTIAVDQKRNIYSRLGAVRALVTTATGCVKASLWQNLNEKQVIFPRRILAELVIYSEFNIRNVNYLLNSLMKLESYRQFETTGLVEGINIFIDKVPCTQSPEYEEALRALLDGFYTLIRHPPYCEQTDIGISEENMWLLPSAMDLIEKMVFFRSGACLDKKVLDLLLAFAQIRDWHGDHIQEYKGALSELVPVWPELNDALFWRAVENRRTEAQFKNCRLIDDWHVQWPGHFFKFDVQSFERVLNYVSQKKLLDDRLVALSLALRIYTQSNNNERFLSEINEVVQQHHELVQKVELYFNPPFDPKIEALNKQREESKRKGEEKRAQNELERTKWIQRVKAKPEDITNPQGLAVGEISNGQYWLYQEINKHDHLAKNHDWHDLIETFGMDVAFAFRDAAIAYWRNYKPENKNSTSIPFKLVFGLLGLEIEFKENSDFPRYLSSDEVQHALLYLTKEMNGFPDWLEKMYQTYPEMVLDALWKEIEQEFANESQPNNVNQLLHCIVYQAPWSHMGLAQLIYQWLEKNEPQLNKNLRNCIRILINGGVSFSELAKLASAKIGNPLLEQNTPIWFALYVDTSPDEAIPELNKWLKQLPEDSASNFAQHFVTTLTGKFRHGEERTSFTGGVRKPSSLKELFLLMTSYIKPEDDLDRTTVTSYTPTLRDDAQSARDLLFQWLAGIPGKETYVALMELIHEYPYKHYTHWMMRAARNRAVTDADFELWTDEQVRDFDASLMFTPTTPAQLYEMGVHYLLDFKDWLELGNDSLAKTYQKITSETEMRNVVAHHVQNAAKGRFTCAQEAELANSQRPDIWLQHSAISVPIPVELKLLDKSWSGPSLCERLENQLVGDYLRENEANFGVFLLVWQGKNASDKSWVIDGKKTNLDELENALTYHWLSISNKYPMVNDIKIIVIDLSVRERRSAE
ncbi:NACHT domain-containing protein [Pectobacterium aroidearum]|uniref:NACHT domain-containing protein n=1 Tax=Pectobacterium aroidearum TaxID=1201031 RepID=UPI002A82CA51|nr:hypothetical protein [Pectobacterium aroidearum]MDY4386418.1 hypothetical protein [Pectobacterium aroidearum]